MANTLPPPPTITDNTLYRWLYLAYQAIINALSASGSGLFGAAGVTTANKGLLVDSTKSLDYLDLGELSIDGTSLTSTPDELNQIHNSDIRQTDLISLHSFANKVHSASIAVGVEDTDVIPISIQLTSATGGTAAGIVSLMAYLSDTADGSTVTNLSPDTYVVVPDGVGYLTSITTDGADSNRLFHLISDVNGSINISISDTTTRGWYLVLMLPYGKIKVSDIIQFS